MTTVPPPTPPAPPPPPPPEAPPYVPPPPPRAAYVANYSTGFNHEYPWSWARYRYGLETRGPNLLDKLYGALMIIAGVLIAILVVWLLIIAAGASGFRVKFNSLPTKPPATASKTPTTKATTPPPVPNGATPPNLDPAPGTIVPPLAAPAIPAVPAPTPDAILPIYPPSTPAPRAAPAAMPTTPTLFIGLTWDSMNDACDKEYTDPGAYPYIYPYTDATRMTVEPTASYRVKCFMVDGTWYGNLDLDYYCATYIAVGSHADNPHRAYPESDQPWRYWGCYYGPLIPYQ
jgi:hypothetical protein